MIIKEIKRSGIEIHRDNRRVLGVEKAEILENNGIKTKIKDKIKREIERKKVKIFMSKYSARYREGDAHVFVIERVTDKVIERVREREKKRGYERYSDSKL